MNAVFYTIGLAVLFFAGWGLIINGMESNNDGAPIAGVILIIFSLIHGDLVVLLRSRDKTPEP